MKKISIVLVVSFLMSVISAQIYVGGGLGFSVQSGSYDDGTNKTDDPSRTSFSITPNVGKFINEYLAVGLDLTYSSSKVTTPDQTDPSTGNNVDQVDKQSTIRLAPYVRYYLIKLDKLSVFGQASLSYSSSSSETTLGSQSNDGPKITTLGLGAMPGIEYAVNDRISIYSYINLLSISATTTSSKQDMGSVTTEQVTNRISFAADSEGFQSLGTINLSLYVKLN